jgi:hypothetical protein
MTWLGTATKSSRMLPAKSVRATVRAAASGAARRVTQ